MLINFLTINIISSREQVAFNEIAFYYIYKHAETSLWVDMLLHTLSSF